MRGWTKRKPRGDKACSLRNSPSPQLSAGDGGNHNEGLFAGGDCLGQGRIRPFMRQVFLAGKKSQERTALERHVITYRPAQHGISAFQRIQHRALRYGRGDFKLHLTGSVCQVAKVGGKNDAHSHDAYIVTRTGRFVIRNRCRKLRKMKPERQAELSLREGLALYIV